MFRRSSDLDHALVERVVLRYALGMEAGDKRISYVGGDYGADWLATEVDAGRADFAILIAPVTVDGLHRGEPESGEAAPQEHLVHPESARRTGRRGAAFGPCLSATRPRARSARAALWCYERLRRMRVYVGSDHAGFELKTHLVGELIKQGHEVVDVGAKVYDAEDDYPAYCIVAGGSGGRRPGQPGRRDRGLGQRRADRREQGPGRTGRARLERRDRDAGPPAQQRERGRHRGPDAHARGSDGDRDPRSWPRRSPKRHATSGGSTRSANTRSRTPSPRSPPNSRPSRPAVRPSPPARLQPQAPTSPVDHGVTCTMGGVSCD